MTWVLGATVETPIGELVLRNEAPMAGVTELALHELQWPLHLERLLIPRLMRLEIVLDSFAVKLRDPRRSRRAVLDTGDGRGQPLHASATHRILQVHITQHEAGKRRSVETQPRRDEGADVMHIHSEAICPSLRREVELLQRGADGASSYSSPARCSSVVAALRQGLCAVETSSQRVLRAVNDSAPINQLPDDVLLHALCYGAFDDQAEHHERSMELWFTDTDGLTKAAASLARFAGVPISLTLVVHKESGALGDLLIHNVARIRKLSIQIQPFLLITQSANERPPVDAVMMALRQPAPMLEELDLGNFRRSWIISEDIYLPEDLLAGSAPLLRSLNARGFALRDLPYPALASLQNLALSQFEVNLPHVFASYPNLEQLHIEAVSLSSETTWTTLPNLNLLSIPGTENAVEIVCTQLVPARPLKVWAEAVEDDFLGYVLAHTPKTDVRSVCVYLDVHSMQPMCVISHSSGITWVLGLWPFSESLGVAFGDSDIIGSISELAVHELAWPCRPLELPVAARLTRLELVLYCFAFRASDRDVVHMFSGIFCDDGDARCILQCPMLEELAIFSPILPSLVVDVFDVLDFISTSVRYTSRCLQLLSLRNVRLYDPAHGRGMELLTARFRRLEYLDFREPPIPYIHRKNSSMSWVYAMMG
ncbi:hypothetical protein AURDEDRAFT_187857 [Auricularia subglabra TFB-10046 SS5]|uniref:F-box domain-containing protein n=1 Tax=Auricularia subglabra (strain TFB-10046 / SS5) TaxID=717982 RepID=J0WWY3_AURST|nr:hypothetical protein AURDEDRAFT_187857 [Auricularia subglabra TFB-10046 SS5]